MVGQMSTFVSLVVTRNGENQCCDHCGKYRPTRRFKARTKDRRTLKADLCSECSERFFESNKVEALASEN